MPKDLKFKKTKGRIKIIKALPYKGCNVVIRQVDETLFEYILVFDSQIYSAYIEVTMKKGQTKFNLIITGQIYHHSGRGNQSANILTELKKDKYIDYIVGCSPKEILTVDNILDKLEEYLFS